MTLQSAWLAETGQTRNDTRLAALGATTPADPVSVRSGILPGSYNGQFRVSGFWMTGESAMVGRVAEGRAVIQGAISQGAYPLAMPVYTDLTFADGDAQYGRIDLVVLRVYDNAYDSSGKTEATVEIVQGTPAAAPTAPAAPALSLPLYEVSVPAGTSAGTGGIAWQAGALTDLRATTVAAGGILPAYGDTGNGAYPGQYRDNQGVLERWDGSAWQPYQPPVEVTTTSTGLVAATGWSVVSFAGRQSHGLGSFSASVTRTGATLTVDSTGNLGDVQLCTLPSGWAPSLGLEAVAADGWGSGDAYIGTDGTITLRTWSYNGELTSGRNVRVSATYVL
ncbi:hypothetical protein [Streptomyces beihaiensis]|uniref:Uncharacterized protein n=1 Tax=Streptomyces beihaiensis TaxID=2984495 RepID=A0ABT3U114_9ACTN|nr:hypothetical protein [Streptomyces beihaiensis]MCX3061873.1 hypothetical protein [Streptomyces beihaiensis]